MADDLTTSDATGRLARYVLGIKLKDMPIEVRVDALTVLEHGHRPVAVFFESGQASAQMEPLRAEPVTYGLEQDVLERATKRSRV